MPCVQGQHQQLLTGEDGQVLLDVRAITPHGQPGWTTVHQRPHCPHTLIQPFALRRTLVELCNAVRNVVIKVATVDVLARVALQLALVHWPRQFDVPFVAFYNVPASYQDAGGGGEGAYLVW